MQFRPAILIAAATSLVAVAPAFADIGFAAAAAAARGAAADATLLQVEQRLRNGVLVYDADLFAAPNLNRNVRINATTGAAGAVETSAIEAEGLAIIEQILSMLPNATIDFGGAVERAVAASPEGAAANKVSLDIELGMLAYQVLLNDDALKVYVDSVTGNVVPHHGGGDDDGEDSVPGTNFGAALSAAMAATGLPVLSAEAEIENLSGRLETIFWNAKSGELVMVTSSAADGAILSTVSWTPSADQLARIADEIAVLGSVTVDARAALDTAMAQHPTASFHGVELKAEDAGPVWKVELTTAQGFELDVFVDADASVPAFRIAAAVNFAPADLNRDGAVNGFDLGMLLGNWGAFDPVADLDGDNVITGFDLGLLLGAWQP